jgi:hypothetical protein
VDRIRADFRIDRDVLLDLAALVFNLH